MELQVKGALMIQEMFKVSVVGDVQDGKDFASNHFEDKKSKSTKSRSRFS
jgi:hypothetical protein